MKGFLILIGLIALTACSSPPKPPVVDGKSRVGINNCSSIHSFLYSEMISKNEQGTKSYTCNLTNKIYKD